MSRDLSIVVIRESADYTVVQVVGELDHAYAGDLVAEVDQLLTGGHQHVRIDLSGVTFFDAGGVRALQTAALAAGAANGTVTIVDPSPAVARILAVVDLDGLVEQRSSVAERGRHSGASPASRRHMILARLGHIADGEPVTERLGQVCAEVTNMTGAGIMLMSDDVPRMSLATTNTAGELIERLQYELGEGPCVDAHNRDHPVLEPNLASPDVERWPAFRGPVVDAGVHAIFGFPMRVGGVNLGALNLHRNAPGPLSDDQHATALVMAEVAAEVILAVQADALPGQLAVELEAGVAPHTVVHQATGMVAVQLGVSIAEAMIRLRAHAYAYDQTLHDVAEEVVGRSLRLDGDRPDIPLD